MITENLSTLKIHKLTEEQYKRELEAGNIKDNEIYLTPDVSSGGGEVVSATIGTSWTEEETGAKTQVVTISEITSEDTAKVDHCYTGDGSSDSYATFVEEENQYLTYITNGFAETVDGGIKFTIFGDANTVAIPIVVEVV